ncbi:MAG TPA: VWA domain-containing protein [Thermoanaerobaculia bacterium]|nr:VWA domain-containing protein [Thermoanaerobaculia bacterium]
MVLVFAALIACSATAAVNEPLTRTEQKTRIAALPDKHRQFLLDTEPILQTSERDAFLRLETDAQRDAFIEDFWRRRDIADGTTNHAARARYFERLEYVKENFEAVASDRGKVYLLQGPPAETYNINCTSSYQPIEIWRYPYLENFGHDFWILFYIPRGHREYRYWQPIKGKLAWMALDDLRPDVAVTSGAGPKVCQHEDILGKALAIVQQDADRLPHVFDAPPVNEEDMRRILRSAVIGDPNAPPLAGAELSVRYGAATQLVIYIPKSQLKTTTTGNVSVYTIDVVGEVMKSDMLWEKYRYRFDFPGDVADEKLPIVIDRTLRPAVYRSRVKITDAASNAQAILETDLNVPEPVVVATTESKALEVIREELQSTRASLKIVPQPDSVLSGLRTIETIISGTGIQSVEFWLDGKRVATRRSPPYTLDLDFGTVPRSRKIRAVALDAHDQIMTGDEIVVNTGADPFRVRIASPRVAPKISGPTRVEVEAKVPEGKELAHIELYYNEQRVATLYDAPFVQRVNIPATDGVGYLRAVASLKDPETDPVEDVVMVNTPDYIETIDVHLVELPTTVLRNGKPVNDLKQDAFKVLDEGQPVQLAKFEHVKNLPLSIGMAVDTSGSMDTKMPQTRAAASAFFQNVIRKGDRAFIVAFDSSPHVVQKWTPDLTELNGGLAKLRPEESTALYDAVVYSLYNFHGVKGQKALVLLTDGKDTVSKFTFEQALEYAQRAAVPIYTIGIGIRMTEMNVRAKLTRLCTETGGTSYYIDSTAELSKIYTDIQNELRSQYLLGFYPQAQGTRWRELTVDVADARVKTIRGYYP